MSITDLDDVAAKLTPPFALKGLGHAHKSEAGLVRLGLGAEALAQAASAMVGANGFLVEEMVAAPVAELLVGIRREPPYGISLTIGMGGVSAELLRDTQTLVLPVAGDDVHAAINRLKMAPLLFGYRGRPVADVMAAVEAIMALIELVMNNETIDEIEINPLMLAETGGGATAADAVIWISQS
jgi:acyl-CoA synthetase (NDP forming)